jgi:hypothetical protein
LWNRLLRHKNAKNITTNALLVSDFPDNRNIPRIKLYIRLTGAYQVAVKKGLQEDVRILETFFHIPLKVKDARGKRET